MLLHQIVVSPLGRAVVQVEPHGKFLKHGVRIGLPNNAISGFFIQRYRRLIIDIDV